MTKNQPPDLPPVAERRPKPRTRVLVGGVVVWDLGRSKLNCKIRDINDGGARVAVPRAKDLPPVIHLINVKDHICHESRIAWRGADEMGLAFLNSYDLLQNIDPARNYLRKIWDERANVNALWKG